MVLVRWVGGVIWVLLGSLELLVEALSLRAAVVGIDVGRGLAGCLLVDC